MFNYSKHNRRYGSPKDQLELLAEWLALEKEFIPLFKVIREVGDKTTVDDIYKMIFTGNIKELKSLINPNNMTKLFKGIQGDQIKAVSSAISSIVAIIDRIGNQPIFAELANFMNNKNKDEMMKKMLEISQDELVNYFSDELIQEIRANPGLIPALRTGRVGMGVSPGLPQARLTTDIIGAGIQSKYPNYGAWVTNFMNLLTTLMHRAAMPQSMMNMVLPDRDIQISPQQQFAFTAVCESGADPTSHEAQYNIMRWMESTEAPPKNSPIELEEKLPTVKSLEMIKRLADLLGEQTFKENGKDKNTFDSLYDILSTNPKPHAAKWNGSQLERELLLKGIDSELIKAKFYSFKMNVEKILLEAIPEQFRNLYFTTKSIRELSEDQKALYKQKYPEVAQILNGLPGEVNQGKEIRTAQLLTLKQGVTQAWGTHFKRFHESIKSVFSNINADKFVQFIYMDDDVPIRQELIDNASNLGYGEDISNVVSTTQDPHELVALKIKLNSQLGNSKKEQNLMNGLNKLIRTLRFKKEFMESCNIDDLNMFREILSQRDQLLDLGNLLSENIPGMSRLWSEPTVIAGREIMTPEFTGEISKANILQSGGFNPLCANRSFKEAIIKKNKESIDEYKERMSLLLQGLLDEGTLRIEDPSQESPLSLALLNKPRTSNTAILGVHNLLDNILKEQESPSEEDGEENILEESPEIETQLRIKRKMVLDELLTLQNMTEEDVGVISLNPSSKQNIVDSEFAPIGLSTDSAMSAKVLDIFRNYYNLPICSYQIEINSPEECLINKNGFRLDFVILADRLVLNPNGTLGILPSILLIGEAFGYKRYTGRPLIIDAEHLPEENRNRQIKRNIRLLQDYQKGIESPDGEYKIYLSEDGKQLLSDYPKKDKEGNKNMVTAPADRFVEYSIRSSYKEPYETFLSHVIGADTIFIPPFDVQKEQEISEAVISATEQLDRLAILWETSNKESAAVRQLREYVKKNGSGALDPRLQKYITQGAEEKNKQRITEKPFSNAELYARTLLTHFDLQNIVIPLYYANPELFKLKEMVNYKKQYDNLCQQLADTTDRVLINHLAMQIMKVKEKYSFIKNKYEQFTAGEQIGESETDKMYQKRILQKRQDLEKIVDMAVQGQLDIAGVHAAVFGEKPLFSRLSVVNSVNYYQLPPSVYQQSKVVTSRWWGGIR